MILPHQPRGPALDEAPVFQKPWEARVFAIVLVLHKRGLFTWPEWASALAAHISAAQSEGDADLGDTYYWDWLRALESLLTEKGASCAAELLRFRQAWSQAAERTPHGHPIELLPADFPGTRSDT